MRESEQKDEIWEQKTDICMDVSQSDEQVHEGLFFRIARQRADYFADVDKVPTDLEIDDRPTRCYSAFLQSLGFSVVPLNTGSSPTIEDRPTNLLALVEPPTNILPAIPVSPETVSSKLGTAISITVGPARESYGTHLGSLLKRSGVYALASMVSPFVALALSPFLTRHLTRSDYGALTVLATAIALTAGLSQLGLNAAFFRVYSYDYETIPERKSVVAMTLLLLLCCVVPLAGIEYATAPWLASVLLGSPGLASIIQIAALVILLQNLTVPGFAWLRAEGKAIIFAVLSVANLLTNLGLTVLLVGKYDLGIAGALLATGGGYGLVLLCTLPLLLFYIGRFKLRLDIARALLAFGLPNAVSFASAWMLQLADRFLLAHMRSLSETATYGVAYTLGGALSVVVLSPFSLAWPSTLFLIARRRDARHVFRLIFRWYALILLFMTYALSLAGLFVLNVFFPAGYRGAAIVIPLVALSTMFYGFYNYFTLGMNICKKLWYAVLFLASAALLNIGLNFVLIPFYGSLGAAIATVIAYVVLALETYLLNRHIYPVPFEVGLAGLGLGLIIGCYLLGSFLAQGHTFWVFWGISFAFLLLCGICLCALGWLWTVRYREPQEGKVLATVPLQPEIQQPHLG